MAWGKIDDDHYDHPKVMAMPREVRNAADGLYWRAISYSNRKRTDGVITASVVALLDGTEAEVAALVEVELWHRSNGEANASGLLAGCFVINDFSVYNKTRIQLEREHEIRAAAGREGGWKSGKSRSGKGRRSKPEANASALLQPVRTPVPGPVPGPSDVPPPPAERGSRADGTSPRQRSSAPRDVGANPRSKGTSPRQIRQDQKTGPTQLGFILGEIAARPPVEVG